MSFRLVASVFPAHRLDTEVGLKEATDEMKKKKIKDVCPKLKKARHSETDRKGYKGQSRIKVVPT
jgi:hypothetical protein